MKLPDCRAARRWRRGLSAAGCLAVLAGCAGCAVGVAQVRLPPRTASAPAVPAGTVASAGPGAGAPRQQAAAAVDGYIVAMSAAEQSGNVRQARQLLRPYLAGYRIAGVVRALSAIWARGYRFYGQDDPHIVSVRIAGSHAFVHECDDTADMGLVNSATGQTVPGSAGVADANLLTRLDLIRGRWLVEWQLPEDLSCVS